MFYTAAAVAVLARLRARDVRAARTASSRAWTTNIGDLPFHVGVITGFVHGENFPPQHPEFAGTRLTYPFIVDFVTAMFVRAGASLEGAMFWQNFVLMMSLVGLLHRWALC